MEGGRLTVEGGRFKVKGANLKTNINLKNRGKYFSITGEGPFTFHL
jgi:hypothetical protein